MSLSNTLARLALYAYRIYAEVGIGALHVAAATFTVAVAALNFRQCTGSGGARYIFKQRYEVLPLQRCRYIYKI